MTTTMFFVLLGAATVTGLLMKLVAWLDAPRPAAHRSVRRAVRPAHTLDFPCAELKLESARHAA
ncbi:MAG: hypothetical protein IKN81_07340 [Oscillospiraceae bacterium]|nr:hypothetical protein [Oscillospiraceae bacterium]